eukprot:CAMPEP_0202455506 /NCGR_PEP_ID=MMETSP1360-20130828/13021_1 /ASSEMBLY_ACC=CAM_ASM_000848 /TAXON_ID=515479 /ORGANISM="Licmophora paradoxa, Strain CCMP2313" /LENGTH=434 /DNA_ID=CAMNT_0049075105 /DNA_START=149 /DNA_END=1453 /DNA_ORIENTATION=-
MDSVPTPQLWEAPPQPKPDPGAYVRQPVTSAHMVADGGISARDSVSVSPSGNIVHGRYGDLGVVEGIPLEYLALLKPSAEGAAAVRTIGGSGTLLVYGASQAAGMAAVQLWGGAVVAVVGGEHSGHDELLEILKEITAEPGTTVPEEYAMIKKNFADLVGAVANGETTSTTHVLAEFQENLLDYSKAYPETRAAAVSEKHLDFAGKEKDRATFHENMEAYLHQFPAGSPAFDPEKIKAYLNEEQYAVLRSRFHKQTTAVITGDDVGDFNPALLAGELIQSPAADTSKENDYEFKMTGTVKIEGGGPVSGAVICVTPDLLASYTAVDAAKGVRAKAEALQFLTPGQRNAFAAASSVIAQANGAPVVVVGGSLPGLTSVEPNDGDVKEALTAMDIDEMGESRLNYLIQVYRAGDYPIYADYAVFKAGGPRQIVVTK